MTFLDIGTKYYPITTVLLGTRVLHYIFYRYFVIMHASIAAWVLHINTTLLLFSRKTLFPRIENQIIH